MRDDEELLLRAGHRGYADLEEALIELEVVAEMAILQLDFDAIDKVAEMRKLVNQNRKRLK